MNAGIKAFTEYQQTNAVTAVMDASPHQLTLLLLKAFLDKLSVAKGAMEREDTVLRIDSIRKALDIIFELKGTLNLEQGGEIAAQLDRLYEFSISTLIEANVSKDANKLEEVKGVINEIYEAWLAIAPARGDG